MAGFGGTAGRVVTLIGAVGLSGLTPSAPLTAAGLGDGATAGFCGDDLGAGVGALGAPGTGALGALGAAAGLGAAARGPVATGIFFTSGRCAEDGERVELGALAVLGALFAAGAGRGVPAAGGGAL